MNDYILFLEGVILPVIQASDACEHWDASQAQFLAEEIALAVAKVTQPKAA